MLTGRGMEHADVGNNTRILAKIFIIQINLINNKTLTENRKSHV